MHIINVFVRGGTVQGVSIPKGSDVMVRIVDYDCEEIDCPDTDDEGSPCSIEIYQTNQNQGE